MDKIDEVLTRGVEQILPSKKGLADLMNKGKIRLYLGIDPTSPKIHLGHAIPLRKLKQFQELGHEVILLIGTFTARIGDPSARDEKRKPLSVAQIKKNMATYKEQASKILDFSKVKIKYNDRWLSKLSFADLAKLTSHFTVPQLLERDMFQRRMKKGGEVWMNEFLYPLMQGYDSVAMNVDLEVGSTDQTFNMLVGRKLQKIYNQKEKFVLTTPMLIGLDGRKMSKTYGNTVNITEPPNEMYGKLMSLHDDLIIQYFELCTGLPLVEIKELEKQMEAGKVNPMELKKKLAREIVGMYHGKKEAEQAEKEFERVFQKRKLPSKIPETPKAVKAGKHPISKLIADSRATTSIAEAKRLIIQGGLEFEGKRVQNPHREVSVKGGEILKIGKRKVFKIKVK